MSRPRRSCKQLAEQVKAGAAVRRTSRGGRNAAESFIAATHPDHQH